MGKRARAESSESSGPVLRRPAAQTACKELTNTVDKLQQNVEKMMDMGGDQVMKNLSILHQAGISVTSSYSGLGTFEFAATRIFKTVAKKFKQGAKQAVTCYSACDIDEAAQAALCKHKPESCPAHVFKDIMDRVPDNDRLRLRKCEKKHLDKWAQAKADYKDGKISESDKRSLHQRLSKQYLTKLHKIFSGVEFLPDAWCIMHQCRCPVSPRKDAPNKLWVECAGSICIAFSKILA